MILEMMDFVNYETILLLMEQDILYDVQNGLVEEKFKITIK